MIAINILEISKDMAKQITKIEKSVTISRIIFTNRKYAIEFINRLHINIKSVIIITHFNSCIIIFKKNHIFVIKENIFIVICGNLKSMNVSITLLRKFSLIWNELRKSIDMSLTKVN